MELDIAILGDGNLVLVDREILTGAAGKARSTGRRHGALDDFGTEAALNQGIALGEAAGA